MGERQRKIFVLIRCTVLVRCGLCHKGNEVKQRSKVIGSGAFRSSANILHCVG